MSDTAKIDQRTSQCSQRKEWQKGAAEVNQILLSSFVTLFPYSFQERDGSS